MKKKITKSLLSSLVFFELGLLFLVFALYILSDPQTLKYVVDRATSKYHISYDAISGNFLKTISIKNLSYKGVILAKEAEIDWSMHALIKGEIVINTLSLQSVNLAQIKQLLQQSKKAPSRDKKPTSTTSRDFPQMRIAHLFLSTLPYKSDIIEIDTFKLELYNIVSDLKELRIDEFSLQSRNNYSNIKVNGEMRKRVLHLKNLDLDKINIAQIEKSFLLLANSDTNSTDTPFTMIEEVKIDQLSATLLPYTYAPYQLKNATLTAHTIDAALKTMHFSAEDILLDAKSNLGALKLKGALENNTLKATTSLNLAQNYFQQFTNIIDFKSLNPIMIELLANQNSVDANITLKSKQLFSGRYKGYLTAINRLKSQLHFDSNSSKLTLQTDANVSSKYAASLHLKDSLMYDGALHYQGTIAIDKLQHFPDYSLPLFQNAIIHYSGDAKDLVANLQTEKLHLLYKMYGYKRADFLLTSKPLEIAQYFPSIPQALHPLKASVNATMALDFNSTETILIENNITSNAINLHGQTRIHKGKVRSETETTLSKNSFLPQIDKNIKFNAIFPATLKIDYHDKRLDLNLIGKDGYLKNDFSYDINSSYLNNTLNLPHDSLTLKGEPNILQLSTHTYSLKTLQESLLPLYHFEKRPYDGEVELNATLQDMAKMDATIKSRWLVYEYKPNHFAFAEKVKIQTALSKQEILIKNYTLHTYLDYDRAFYASKPSTITYHDGQINLLSLWVNDAIKTTGHYRIDTAQGAFLTKTKKYHYKGREGDIRLSCNLTTDIKKENTHIEGDITILEGLITYEHHKTHEISDPDIIIIQEEQAALQRAQEKKSNLSLDIAISSKKPLTYKIPSLEVSLTPDIKIWKESQKELELLGRAVIEHGSYMQGEKEFLILPSELLFGGEILNPYLNLKAQYSNNPYVIDIFITGSLDTPIINFSSNPYLNQSDILSMLLFSTTTDSLFEGNANSSTQALSMLGNTFAKEIIKNFGITLDKLVISTNEQGGLGIEVGKKISKKITVIYTNDIVQSIKVRYQHSNNFETDLMLSPESSGIDFLYKSEH